MRAPKRLAEGTHRLELVSAVGELSRFGCEPFRAVRRENSPSPALTRLLSAGRGDLLRCAGRAGVQKVTRAPLQPELRQRLSTVLGAGQARVGFAVLDRRTAGRDELLPPPESGEDTLERRPFMRTSKEAGASGPADLLPLRDIERGQRAHQRELLIDGRAKTLGAKPSSQGDHGVSDGLRARVSLTRPGQAASRWPPPSGSLRRARSISSAMPSRRTRSMSSCAFSREPRERSATSGSISAAPSAASDSVQSRVSPTPGTRYRSSQRSCSTSAHA